MRVIVEDILESLSEEPPYGQGQRKRRQVPSCLDGIDRLPRYAQFPGQITLAQRPAFAQLPDVVLHVCKASLTSSSCQVSFTAAVGRTTSGHPGLVANGSVDLGDPGRRKGDSAHQQPVRGVEGRVSF